MTQRSYRTMQQFLAPNNVGAIGAQDIQDLHDSLYHSSIVDIWNEGDQGWQLLRRRSTDTDAPVLTAVGRRWDKDAIPSDPAHAPAWVYLRPQAQASTGDLSWPSSQFLRASNNLTLSADGFGYTYSGNLGVLVTVSYAITCRADATVTGNLYVSGVKSVAGSTTNKVRTSLYSTATTDITDPTDDSTMHVFTAKDTDLILMRPGDVLSYRLEYTDTTSETALSTVYVDKYSVQIGVLSVIEPWGETTAIPGPATGSAIDNATVYNEILGEVLLPHHTTAPPLG